MSAAEFPTWTDGLGRVQHTTVSRPFCWRKNGTTRNYRSLEAARKAAPAGSTFFFDFAPGCGLFIGDAS